MAKKNKLARGTRQTRQTKNDVTLTQTTWDAGPSTCQQKAFKVVEPVVQYDDATGKMVNPNGVKRARRMDVIELLHRKGVLSKRQFTAAEKLRNAWETTGRSPPAIKEVNIDSSPKPDAHIAIQIDRMSKFAAIMKHVRQIDREIIDCVVLGNQIPASLKKYRGPNYPAGLARLQHALDRLADGVD